MPELSNPRQEKFCQGIVAGLKPEDAYVQANFAPHRKNAHRLMTHDDIRARIGELRAPLIESVRWDFQTRLMLLRDTALAAARDGDHRAVIAAIAESNRMEGAYRPPAKEPQASDSQAAFSEFIQSIVAAKTTLPVGARSHQGMSP